MHQNLVDTFLLKPALGEPQPTTAQAQMPSVWVAKWVDYSNKYGLGYQLSNNVFGAYFNDSTKMVTGRNSRHCEYIEHGRSHEGRKVLIVDNPTPPHPHDINKKVTLLKYFKNYLLEQSTKAEESLVAAPTSNLVYVKKWLRTKHAIVFRLSNKVVQVNFFDHTKLILSEEATVVTYITPSRQTTTQTLSSLFQDPSATDPIERLKYTRDILYHMINYKKSKLK